MSSENRSPEANRIVAKYLELKSTIDNLENNVSEAISKDGLSYKSISAFCILNNVGMVEHNTCYELFKLPEGVDARWIIESANYAPETVNTVILQEAKQGFESKVKKHINDFLTLPIEDVMRYYDVQNVSSLINARVVPATYLQRRILTSIKSNKLVKASGEDAATIFHEVCESLCEKGVMVKLDIEQAAQFGSSGKLFGYLGA